MNPLLILAICLAVAGLILLFHHGYAHSYESADSLARRESCGAVCYFQLSDIRNHETWILVCFTNAFSLGIILPIYFFNNNNIACIS